MADSGRIVNGAWMPAVDANGYPIPDAYIRVFVNRTTTLASIYADQARTTLLPNPVYADSSGQFPPIWQDNTLMFSLEFGSVSKGPIGTVDDLEPSSSIGGASDKLDKDGGNAAPDILENIVAADRFIQRSEPGAVSKDLLTYLKSAAPIMPDLWNMTAHVVGGPAEDQSAKLQQMLNAAAGSKNSNVMIDKPYYINGTITMPEESGLVGRSQGGEEMNKAQNAGKRPGVIILGPNGKIICGVHCRIKFLSIISLDACSQPTLLYGPTGAVSRIAAWSGTAIEIPPYAADVDVTHNYIVGFDTGVKATLAERHNICWNKIDCHWGVIATQTYDVPRCDQNHIWPFWPTHITFPDETEPLGASPSYTRKGAGIHSLGPNDGWLITNNLVFGFRYGIWVEGAGPGVSNNYANKVRGNWIDNRMAAWQALAIPTYGILVTGAVRLLTIVDNHLDQVTYGLDLDHTPNNTGRTGIIAGSNTFGACGLRWIRCGVGDGIVDGVIAGGSSGQYGIELKLGCGYWTFDNIHACDALNVEAGTGWVDMFGYNGADLPKIKVGTVTAYNNVLFDYRAFGTDVQARKSSDEAFSAGSEAIVTFNTKGIDSLGEFDTATSEFTAKVRGRYTLSGCVGFEPSTTGLANYGLYLYLRPAGGSWTKVGMFAQGFVTNTTGLIGMPFSDCIHLDAGARVKLQFVCSQNATVKAETNVTYLRVYRLPTARA